jgi:hypothetical protein
MLFNSLGQVFRSHTKIKYLGSSLFCYPFKTDYFFKLNKLAIKVPALEIVINEFSKLHPNQKRNNCIEFISRKKFSNVYQGFWTK